MKYERGTIKKGQVALYGSGTLCFLYFLGLNAVLGWGYAFNYFWIALGGLCIAAAAGQAFLHRLPKKIKNTVKAVVVIGAALFLAVEACIISGAFAVPEPTADYVIVLGAKVNGTTPSKRFQERIDAAARYGKQNPQSVIIASGGKGADEGISEAQAIFNSLTEQGIDPQRILLEDRSTSTEENLVNSKALTKNGKKNTVIVTSDFHVFRAVQIAKQKGYEQVSGLPAPPTSHYVLSPNYYVREFFGILNDFVIKKLRETDGSHEQSY